MKSCVFAANNLEKIRESWKVRFSIADLSCVNETFFNKDYSYFFLTSYKNCIILAM